LAYTGDYIQALVAMDDKPDTLIRHDHCSTIQLVPMPTAAVLQILLGQPEIALERLGPLADVGFAYGALHEIDALAHFASNDIDAARHHIRLHAIEAATGRLARQCNDAVMLLAELALVEDDPETAVHLITNMGVARSPGTIVYARDLAQRLGVSDEHANHQHAVRDMAHHALHGLLGSQTAMKALHAELTRRGWD
jgi:hypothetical protein